MHNEVDYNATRKRRKKGEFEMARDAVIYRITSDSTLSPAARLVGTILFLRTNRKHFWAASEIEVFGLSEREIAEVVGMSERNVRRSLRQLEKAGHLVTVLFGSNYAKRTSRYRAIAPAPDVRLPMKINKKDNILLFSRSDTSRQSQARVAEGVCT
jgi:hypothetical protein